MRPIRSAAPIFALVALLAFAAPVAAGGVAIVVPDGDGGVAVTAGEDTTISFTLLQHGVTPVETGTTSVILTELASGESVRLTASATSAAGGYEARFTYPRPGWWSWHVEHDELAIQSQPAVVGIFGPEGETPMFYPGQMPGNAGDALAQNLARVTAERDTLREQLVQATTAAAASAERAAAAEGGIALPLAALAILIAGFAGIAGGASIARATGRGRVGGPVREIAVAMPADAD